MVERPYISGTTNDTYEWGLSRPIEYACARPDSDHSQALLRTAIVALLLLSSA
jgi:hypothetical protein